MKKFLLFSLLLLFPSCIMSGRSPLVAVSNISSPVGFMPGPIGVVGAGVSIVSTIGAKVHDSLSGPSIEERRIEKVLKGGSKVKDSKGNIKIPPQGQETGQKEELIREKETKEKPPSVTSHPIKTYCVAVRPIPEYEFFEDFQGEQAQIEP